MFVCLHQCRNKACFLYYLVGNRQIRILSYKPSELDPIPNYIFPKILISNSSHDTKGLMASTLSWMVCCRHAFVCSMMVLLLYHTTTLIYIFNAWNLVINILHWTKAYNMAIYIVGLPLSLSILKTAYFEWSWNVEN